MQKLIRKYDRGDIKHNDWLDALAFDEIEKIRQVIYFLYNDRGILKRL
jgi:hypothetical protein